MPSIPVLPSPSSSTSSQRELSAILQAVFAHANSKFATEPICEALGRLERGRLGLTMAFGVRIINILSDLQTRRSLDAEGQDFGDERG